VQWNSPKNTAKPGANWTPQPMAATTGAGYRPMVSYASTNSTLYSTELLLLLLLMYYNYNHYNQKTIQDESNAIIEFTSN